MPKIYNLTVVENLAMANPFTNPCADSHLLLTTKSFTSLVKYFALQWQGIVTRAVANQRVSNVGLVGRSPKSRAKGMCERS